MNNIFFRILLFFSPFTFFSAFYPFFRFSAFYPFFRFSAFYPFFRFSAFYPFFRLLPFFPLFRLLPFFPLFRLLPFFPLFRLLPFFPLFRLLPFFPLFRLLPFFPLFRFRFSVSAFYPYPIYGAVLSTFWFGCYGNVFIIFLFSSLLCLLNAFSLYMNNTLDNMKYFVRFDRQQCILGKLFLMNTWMEAMK